MTNLFPFQNFRFKNSKNQQIPSTSLRCDARSEAKQQKEVNQTASLPIFEYAKPRHSREIA